MNTEVNNMSASTEKSSQPPKGKKRKKHNPVGRTVPGVVYSAEELSAVEGEPFWDAVHDGQVTTVSEEGMVVKIRQGAGNIEVQIPKEEMVDTRDHKVGDSIRIYLEDVIKTDTAEQKPFRGSESKAIELDLLDKTALAYKSGELVPAHILAAIKGGFSLALFANNRDEAENGFGLRAFLPMGRAGLRRTENPDDIEVPQVQVKISEFDPALGNIIVSRREVLAAERKKEEAAFFEKLKIGDVVTGKISAVMPYGAFIDLGSIDGFLHMSDISWDKKPRLKDLVVGKDITAAIIEINAKDKKVKLSVKQLNPDPWQNVDKNFRPGTQVKGTIVAFADFGAFVRLENGIEGLIHAGEISWARVKHPSAHFKLGDEVTAAILRVDKEAKRISLSTKELESSPVERLSAEFPIGTVIKTKVVDIQDFGLFVELDENTDALVPRSEISWMRSEAPLDEQFKVGQEVEAAIWGYDPRRQRVTCSLKRVKSDPWPSWKSKYKRGSIHQVKVLKTTKDGLLCELEEGLEGFCPRGQLMDASDQGKVAVRVNDMIEVVVTALDPLKQNVSLSQKGAVESETKEAYQSYLSDQNRSGGAKTTLADAFKNSQWNNNSRGR
jgi:small subunit ribosomal protein S1